MPHKLGFLGVSEPASTVRDDVELLVWVTWGASYKYEAERVEDAGRIDKKSVSTTSTLIASISKRYLVSRPIIIYISIVEAWPNGAISLPVLMA